MKTFSVAVAVAIMFAFVLLQESSAGPVISEQELEAVMINDKSLDASGESAVESWGMPYDNLMNRRRRCRFCCNCCGYDLCGRCCIRRTIPPRAT